MPRPDRSCFRNGHAAQVTAWPSARTANAWPWRVREPRTCGMQRRCRSSAAYHGHTSRSPASPSVLKALGWPRRLLAGPSKFRDTQALVSCTSGAQGLFEPRRLQPRRQALASASDDKTVRIWDRQAGRMLVELKGHLNGAMSVAFSPDGKTLASTLVARRSGYGIVRAASN